MGEVVNGIESKGTCWSIAVVLNSGRGTNVLHIFVVLYKLSSGPEPKLTF